MKSEPHKVKVFEEVGPEIIFNTIKPKGVLAEFLEQFSDWKIIVEYHKSSLTNIYSVVFDKEEDAMLFKLSWIVE